MPQRSLWNTGSTPIPFPLETSTECGWGNRCGWFLWWPLGLEEQLLQIHGCRWNTPHLGAHETQLTSALYEAASEMSLPTVLSSWVPSVTLSTKPSSSPGGQGSAWLCSPLLALSSGQIQAFASALEDIPRDGQPSQEQSRMGKQPTGLAS